MLLQLALVFATTKTGGFIARRWGQPAVLGAILAGLVLGPSVFGVLSSDTPIMELADIGVLILMFVAGLETDIQDMKKAGKAATIAAIGGIAAPFLAGYLLSRAFAYPVISSLFIATILTATSVSISVETLMELKQLRTTAGISIMGAAIIDDILSIILLTFVVTFGREKSLLDLGLVVLKIGIFLAVVVPVGFRLFPTVISYMARLSGREILLTLIFVQLFLFAILTEYLGMAEITGAYLLGLFLSRSRYKRHLMENIEVIGYSFFIPVFFASIGIRTNLRTAGTSLLFAVIFVVVAIITKFAGSALGSKLGGMTTRQAMQIGSGMIPRAEVALIVASLGQARGLIDQQVFSTVVAMVVATTLVTPPLLKWSFAPEE